MKFEYLLLLKQRHVTIMLAITMIVTWLSLQNGWLNMRHIQAEIAKSQQAERERLAEQQAFYAKYSDAGEVGYYVFHNVYFPPKVWSFVALGNRMVTPHMQRIRLLGLQGQLYDGESHHPEYVMLGAFDYAYWLVLLVPLLCIALLHDLKASEQQAQRLDFLTSLGHAQTRFWIKRLIVRWSLIALSLVLPFALFSAYHDLQIMTALQVIGITVLYTGFWALLTAGISLRGRALNASLNAITLMIIWLLLCIVLPNITHSWIHSQYPVQDGSQIALRYRQLVHNAWDFPKAATLEPFYKLYPQWKDTPPVKGRFHWKWYYAFQHMADVKLANQIQKREHALLARDLATSKFAWVLPPLWVQRQLENIAESDVNHSIKHRKQISEFHTRLRHYFYPYLFEEKPFLPRNFADMPRFPSK